VAGVIGYPIKHSRSPLMHNRWLAEHKIIGTYAAIEIAPENLEARLTALASEGLRGINVTIPHKEAIFALAQNPGSGCDDAAIKIGAVNTVIFQKTGGFIGINTDAKGFIANLAAARSPWKSGPALVLGAGGAARAVVYGLIEAGVRHIRIANRTASRAQTLVRDLAAPGHSLVQVGWDTISTQMKDAALLVNTTSLGLEGGAPLDLDLAPLASGALVTDIVYAPLQTPLLKDAGARGLETIDGLGMLIHQARFAFEAWFGILPEASAGLRAALEEDLKNQS
jgi:shikimate dehydrogenase